MRWSARALRWRSGSRCPTSWCLRTRTWKWPPRRPQAIFRPSRRHRRLTQPGARSISTERPRFGTLPCKTIRPLHSRIDCARLDGTADLVAATTRKNYPSLDVPFHSRWRHFAPDGRDRYQELLEDFGGDHLARARMAFDLAIISVLLDAGAGAQW